MSTEIEFKLTADLDKALKEVSGFRKEYAELVKTIEKPLRQVNAFRNMESDLEGLEKATASARVRVRDLGDELIRTENPSDKLQNSYRVAVAELRKLERQEAVHISRLRGMRQELQAAGVDTTDLAREQARLSSALSKSLGAGRTDAARSGIRALTAEQKKLQVAQRQTALEAARSNLGVNQIRAAEAELANLRRQFDLLRASGALTTRELAIAQRMLKQRIAETKAEMKGLDGGGGMPSVPSGGLKGGALVRGGLAGLAAGVVIGGTAAAGRTLEAADDIGRLDARLRLATQSQEEFNNAQVALDAIADSTQGDVAGLIQLYTRLQRPLRDAGMQQQDALDTVEAVSLSLKISGASAQDSDAAVRQFAQAMGSGVLRGDEFNSVLEQSDRLAGALADSLGVTVGKLRELANDGKLTSDVIVRGLQKELPKLRDEVSSFAPELGAAWDRLFDEAGKASGRALKETGITDSVAGFLNDLAKGINSGGNLVKKAEQDLTAIQREEAKSREAMLKQHQATIDRVRTQMLADINSSIAEQQKLLERAGQLYDAARKRQADVAAEFRAASEEFGSGSATAGRASFTDATAAKASARQKLASGDTEGALAEARKAIEVLRQLREEGANEYGFAGVAKELEEIANKATETESKTENVKAALAQMQIDSLKAQADALANIKVGFGIDPENIEQLRQQMQDIAAGLAAQMVIPVRVVPPTEMSAPGTVSPNVQYPGYATGTISAPPGMAWVGERGPELLRFSGGEAVYTAQQSRALAARAASGGRSLPAVPQIAPAGESQAGMADYGSLTINLPGGASLPVRVREKDFQKALRDERRMRGSTSAR